MFNTNNPQNIPIDNLTGWTCLYLSLPTVVFLGGWMNKPMAIAGLILLGWLIWQATGLQAIKTTVNQNRKFIFISLCVAIIWCIPGGAGHLLHANEDWVVRDKVYGDLILGKWPVSYGKIDGEFLILRSAIGYFLPAALIAKFAGLAFADLLLLSWTIIGCWLFLLLLPINGNTMRISLLLLVVISFSGMDWLGIVTTSGEYPIFPLRMEWWVNLSYTSITGQLFWAPNHALALWLATALMLRHTGQPSNLELMAVVSTLTLIWTPFAIIGLAPFLLFQAWNTKWLPWKNSKTASIICACAILAYPILRFLTLDLKGVQTSISLDIEPQQILIEAFNPINFLLSTYAPFVLFEFGILYLLLISILRKNRGMIHLAAIILATLPFFSVGPSNDSLLRLSTPALVIMLWTLLEVLQSNKGTTIKKLFLLIVLLISALTPFNEIYRGVTFRRTPANYAINLVEQQKGIPAHYIGRLNSRDVKLILQEPQLNPNSSTRNTIKSSDSDAN